MFLETMERVFGDMDKIIIDDKQGGQGVVPYLPLDQLMKLIPGASKMKMPAGAMDPKRFKHVEAIILSMTPEERRRPEILNGSRRARIAKGSGRPVSEVNRLLKQFKEMQKFMKQMRGMMGGMGGMPGAPFGN